MKLRIRLAYYLFGLLLGVVFVSYFLKSKADARGVEFCYFPNCRVLQELRKKPLAISEQAKQKLTENWVTLEDIKISMKHGDVDFSKSNDKLKGGKVYFIEGKTIDNKDIMIQMINYETKVVLEDIKKL